MHKVLQALGKIFFFRITYRLEKTSLSSKNPTLEKQRPLPIIYSGAFFTHQRKEQLSKEEREEEKKNPSDNKRSPAKDWEARVIYALFRENFSTRHKRP